MKFPKRCVPWHTPFPILKRRQLAARLKRKGIAPEPPSHPASPAEQALIDFITRNHKPREPVR